MVEQTCPIWGIAASVGSEDFDHILHVDSPRAGGRYSIFSTLNADNLDPPRKAILTTWLVDQRRLGIESPRIDRERIADLNRRLRPVHERADRLLTLIEMTTPTIGCNFNFARQRLDSQAQAWVEDESLSTMMAWSESVDFTEVFYLVEFLEQRGLIAKKVGLPGQLSDGAYRGKADYFEYQITPEGYSHLATLEARAVNSEQAFVAMWFDDSMRDASRYIEQGITDAGYRPLRIDRKDHNNKIDDEIIAEIRRSRFLVADFTQGESGARGGVYYEAGFAHGLSIPVIFTCRADLMKGLHFDTRQYNHILWTADKFEEFAKALSNRISATIGDGPHKKDVDGN